MNIICSQPPPGLLAQTSDTFEAPKCIANCDFINILFTNIKIDIIVLYFVQFTRIKLIKFISIIVK